MEQLGILRKPISYRGNYESESLLKSSPNILENLPFENLRGEMLSAPGRIQERPRSPRFSDTVDKNLFMSNVIKSPNGRKPDPAKEASIRRSLEEISKDIKEIEDFLTVTENVIKKERESEIEFPIRDRHRSKPEDKQRKLSDSVTSNKENKTPTPVKKSPSLTRKNSVKSPTFKINSFKVKRAKPGSPRFCNSKLYFRNGKIGCVEAEQNVSNIESTHALVKHIIKYENEKPLVNPESVRKVLQECQKEMECDIKKVQESSHSVTVVDNIPEAVVEDVSDHVEGDCNKESDEVEVKINYDEVPEQLNEEASQKYMEDTALAVCEQGSNEQMVNSDSKSLDNEGQEFVRDQVRHLVRRFTLRASKMRKRLDMPPTPSSSASSPSPTPQSMTSVNQPERGVKRYSETFVADDQKTKIKHICPTSYCGGKDSDVLDPQGNIYISWLCVVSLSFLYNAWVIPLRSAFPFQTPDNEKIWMGFDICADAIYVLDVLLFKHRLMYLFEGFWVKDPALTRKNYMRKLQFKLDLLSLLPLELFYLKFGTNAVYWRFPRLLKIQSFWEVFKLLDRMIASPHFVRVAKTLSYMLYMIHLTACSYYAYSAYQGLGTNRWVFSGKGHPYVRCFAFATKTATSIGKNPKPEKEGELVFMTAAWLMGVFVFALLIGQIRDIISTATRSQSEYRQLEDETLEYMRRLNLPSEMQRRVKMWFKFTWDQQRTLDESHILDSLPANLKTDIAISVHIQTLSKVQLFADCEEALLRELVLKLRAVTFLPGDYVCRKGEVGKEMYIIKVGQVLVMGGPNNDDVLATLSEGSVFGEISLLAINGVEGNRRTADVRSKGYSNLFVLSKSDLNEAIVYYPNAQAILKKRARSLVRKNAEREREEARRALKEADVVIGNPTKPQTPPKLLKTVIQALPEESPAVVLLTKGSKKNKKKKPETETLPEDTTKEMENHSDTSKQDDAPNFTIENEKRPKSPDLLSSIEHELKSKNKLINLTDSEKALIISSCSSNENLATTQNENAETNE